MPALQSLFVNEREIQAIEFIETFVERCRVESRPRFTKRVMLRFVKQCRVAPEFFSQLVFQHRLEIILLLCAQAKLIKPVTHIAREQLVRSFAGQDHRDAARFSGC